MTVVYNGAHRRGETRGVWPSAPISPAAPDGEARPALPACPPTPPAARAVDGEATHSPHRRRLGPGAARRRGSVYQRLYVYNCLFVIFLDY
ncbi:hypothetical protein ODS41_02585 [Pyrobaculum sp. 3827-6]|uniref:hypothetical protein n=1 Tax=Pyrobaculum sp. 3827-6 TaxID=2983604 RepID=UPI0021D86613|nr:hypothetical protein [Pyrobaculum sp. 3827-6]MCU7786817.1 hypothetical protein [Pyrobaculum sp. 3827-6]